jgi:peptide/nickel transport system ATP-binding protein
MTSTPLLEVQDLVVRYRPSPTNAVDGVSFDVQPGETVGLVGESGSGKSTIGRALLGLTPASAGTIRFDGEDITTATKHRRRELSSDIQVVFQDPYSSLNPTKTIRQTLREPFLVRRSGPRLSREAVDARVDEMLQRVGLPIDSAERYPNQFSGGQRQRIAIARALMLSPRLVICDEPVSALDLSVQAQVVNLLADLQQQLGLSYLFIAHDLAIVRYLSQRIVVLRRGQIVESGPAAHVYREPQASYTRALLEAAPSPDPSIQRRRSLRTSAVRAAGSP